MSQQNIERIIDEAKGRVHGKEEIESVDALTIASSDKARDWLIAGIVPLGSVTLLAAAGGTGKAQPSVVKGAHSCRLEAYGRHLRGR
jgi:hypothetical protein